MVSIKNNFCITRVKVTKSTNSQIVKTG